MGIQWPGQRPDQSFASAAFVPDVATPLLAGAGGTLVTRDPVNRDPVNRDPVNRGQDSR
jgi:hypothetical protein